MKLRHVVLLREVSLRGTHHETTAEHQNTSTLPLTTTCLSDTRMLRISITVPLLIV